MKDIRKVALITGVDHGLGLSFLNNLLKQGWLVFGSLYGDPDQNHNAIEEKYHGQVYLFQMDISKDESVDDALDEVLKQSKHVDLLINNGATLGKTEGTIMDKLDFDDILNTINVNSLGPLRVTNKLSKALMNSHYKTVVNISSEAASIGNNERDAWYGYCMSKSALNMAGAIVHKKMSQAGGRVLQIHPGYLQSYMLGHLNTDGRFTVDEAADKILKVVEDVRLQPLSDQALYLDNEGHLLPW